MKSVEFKYGDVFIVKNSDGLHTLGQVLSPERRAMKGISCAFFNKRVDVVPDVHAIDLREDLCISAILVTDESLSSGFWPIIGNCKISISRSRWPCQWQLRFNKSIGIKIRGSKLVEQFLDAYFSLRPWDDWYRPDYLDDFLISPDKKPKNLLYKNRK